MKLKLKEEPGEWRKQALLAVVGLAVLSSLLRWRRVLPPHLWLAVLVVLGIMALGALLRPRWFRGYYRFSMRVGFVISQAMGFVALVLFFLFILTPVGFILRLAGKDPLQLKRRAEVTTFWQPAKNDSPLDRLF
jgi:hypothetical protein